MAQARKIETYERKGAPVANNTTKENSTKGNNMSVKVKKPESMVSHKNTKQAVDNAGEVANAKTVKKEKLTRAQIIENMTMAISDYSAENPKVAAITMKKYLALFQLDSASDFMVMVQDVTEDATIVLKNGFRLPIIPKEGGDLEEFLDLFTSIVDENSSPTRNIVNFAMANPEFDVRTALFTYALFELVGMGRRTPNTDWDEVDGTSESIDIESEGLFSQVYLALDAYASDPENEAGNLKGILMGLAPESFAAFNQLFNKDSFKKLGITITSPTEGKDAILTPVISEIISYMMFDTFGDFAPVEVEEEEEEEAEPEVKKSTTTSQKSMPKQKVEVDDEDEDEEEDSEDEELEADDEESDDIEVDEDDEYADDEDELGMEEDDEDEEEF